MRKRKTVSTPEIKIDDFLSMTEEQAHEWIERTTGLTLRPPQPNPTKQEKE